MKKILFLLVLSICTTLLRAQMQSRLDIAMRYLEQNLNSLNLTKSDIEDMLITHEQTDRYGISYIYFNQTVKGRPIKNAILNFTISKEGKVAYVANNFVSNKDSKVVTRKSKLDATDAFHSAAIELGYTGFRAPKIASREAGKVVFEKSFICDNEVVAEEYYDYKDGKLTPVWQLTMDMSDNADYWEIRIDANKGTMTSKNNLTVYCTHHKGMYSKHKNCEAHHIAEHKSVNVQTALQGMAGYRVYALPAESPNHGEQKLVFDPHYPEVSPFGWHDTNGIPGHEFTITKGNNVEAFTDKDDDDSKDATVEQPNGGSNLLFDFVHDKTKEPVDNAASSQTNLFYMVNMMHDLSGLHGFDEESGNFQSKNYTGKGKGNDYVIAQSFDGFEANPQKLDNANFSTPVDGGNGRMQMFLWGSPTSAVTILEPLAIAGPILSYGTGNFGNPIPKDAEPALEGPIVIAKDNTATNPTECCKPIPADLKGKIALIDRGGCNFSLKAKHAEDKGAIAVIICNIAGVNGGTGEEIINMSAGNIVPQKITSIFLKKSDCDKIRLQLNSEISVKMKIKNEGKTGPDFLDGAYDNGIIAHEFGHGISSRLTGGPAAAACLTNEEQMGEGWSDFFSLIFTVEPGDKGTDARGIGTYANGELTSGRGIRRFPYSTDMAINPQTYDDIKGNKNATGVVSPHPVGEIWAACLWDLHWKMVEKYGWDADWRNENSGNAKTLRLVIHGMKIQGCNPGYIRGRDAILKADSLLYNGVNGYDIWDVFARRGLGYYADGGNPNDINDGKENFDTNPYKIELLKIEKSDIDLVKPKSEFTITLNTVNHVKSTQSGVNIKDDVPPGFTLVSSTVPGKIENNQVVLELGNKKFDEKKTISYKLKASDVKSIGLLKYDFEKGEEDWEIDVTEGTTTFILTDQATKSGTQAWYAYENNTDTDMQLISPIFKVVGTNPALRFWHRFETEQGTDGGFLEISTDGGNAWQIIRDGFIKNGYNSNINYSTFAIPSLKGFTGSSNNKFIDSYLDLSPWKGQDIRIRFRFGTNASVASNSPFAGWFIDDVELMDLVVYETKACISNSEGKNGSCSGSRKIVMDSDGTVNTQDLPNITNYEVYPNPANDYITVDILSSKSSNVSISLTTIDGRLVMSKNKRINLGRNIETFYTDELQSGFYLLHLKDGEAVSTKKIIIH